MIPDFQVFGPIDNRDGSVVARVVHGDHMSMIGLQFGHEPTEYYVWSGQDQPIRKQSERRYLAPTGPRDLIFNLLLNLYQKGGTDHAPGQWNTESHQLANVWPSAPWSAQSTIIDGSEWPGHSTRLGKYNIVISRLGDLTIGIASKSDGLERVRLIDVSEMLPEPKNQWDAQRPPDRSP